MVSKNNKKATTNDQILTGQIADPAQVAKEIRHVRDAKGGLVFSTDEWSSQCQAHFESL